MNSIIVGKFGNQDPFIPIILSLIDKELEELLNLLFDMFGLSVCLQVVSCGHSHFNTKDLAESTHEFGDELSPSVADHFLRKAVRFPDIVTEEPGDPQ